MSIKKTVFSFDVLVLFFLTLVLSGCYLYLILLVDAGFKPVWSDEFFYYVNTYSFFESNSLKAALTNSGKGSLLFGADMHGFAYPLIHGFFARIIGWHDTNAVLFNFIFFILATVIVWIQRILTVYQKWQVSIVMWLFPFFSMYAFTYMQEVIHLFFAVCLGLLLQQISIRKERRVPVLIFFVSVVFVAGLFRASWFLVLTGLLPFIEGEKRLLKYACLVLIMVFSSFIFTWLLVEPVHTFFYEWLSLIGEEKFLPASILLLGHFKNNFIHYFFTFHETPVYSMMKLVFLGLVIYFCIKAFKDKSKLVLSFTFIGITNFLFLFLLYDVSSWRDIRLLSPLFYMMIPAIIAGLNRKTNFFLLVFMCFLFTIAMPLVIDRIKERNGYSAEITLAKKNEFLPLKQLRGKLIRILIKDPPADHTLDLVTLPIQNSSGNPIYYIVPYYEEKNLQYDFILCKPGTILPQKMIMETPGFILYAP